MRAKTSDLSGKALNYAVACADGMDFPSARLFPYPDEREWLLHDDGTIRNAVEVPSNARSRRYDYTFWNPATDWSQGGPIIEREGIGLRAIRCPGHSMDGLWLAAYDHGNTGTLVRWVKRTDWRNHYLSGPTPLIAAMRCFVASKLGDEVDVPEELLR